MIASLLAIVWIFLDLDLAVSAMAQSSWCGKNDGRFGLEDLFVSPLPHLLATCQRSYLFLCEPLRVLYVARVSVYSKRSYLFLRNGMAGNHF